MGSLYRTLTGQSQKSYHSDGAGSAHPTLTKTSTTDPLSGVLNHLTESQSAKLDAFKELLQKEGWWTPDGFNGKPSHDDGTLLRYLRARKFDIRGAYGQFTDTEKWLKEQNVNELYENFDVEHYEKARLMYPQWTGHRDRRGIPIYVFMIKNLDGKTVSKYQKDAQAYKDSLPSHKKLPTPAKLLPLFALYHSLLNFVLPLVSTLERPNPEVPVTNSTNIVDISGVGLTQFWNLKAHMQDASVLATAHYPETLDRIFIIGAPAFFPTVWGWIKRWFDPVTVSKIFILAKHEVQPTLEKFMDPKDFPRKYGGQLDWDCGQVPHLDDETREALERDGNKGWIKGPALWLNNQRVIVGSEKGKLRRSLADIEKLKPVVYAADGTEEPVHPEARRTSAKSHGDKVANGIPTAPPAYTPGSHPSAAAQAAPAVPAATAAATTPVQAVETKKPFLDTTSAAPAVLNATESKLSNTTELPPEIKKENIRAAPIDGALVYLPEHQASWGQTAEYIQESKMNGTAPSQPQPQSQPEPQTSSDPSQPTSGPTTAATTTAPITNGTNASHAVPITPTTHPETHSHPPSQPLPGPTPPHNLAMNKEIAKNLAGESVSTIPAITTNGANGDIPHPEIVVSSDPTKGLAIEAGKLERPGMPAERFVTAAEIPVEGKV